MGEGHPVVPKIHRDGPRCVVPLCAASAWLGHDTEAKGAIAGLLKVYPGFTVQTFADIAATITYNSTFAEQVQRIIEGLRKAGLPDGKKKTN
jgi:hypothetical protein